MRRVVITDAAEDSLRSINRYIANQSGRAMADAVQDKLLAKIERLALLPGTLGSAREELGPGFRSTPHKGFIVYFRYSDDALEIIDVLDGRRDTRAHFTETEPDI